MSASTRSSEPGAPDGRLHLVPATPDDFAGIYRLCEATLRGYVEADLGDCFEQVAHKALKNLLAKGAFSKMYLDGHCVGALAVEACATHVQLEELYVEPAHQSRGLGTAVMRRVMAQAAAQCKPVHLHVLASNPARAFYELLGFVITRQTRQVTYLAWNPAATDRPPVPAPAC